MSADPSERPAGSSTGNGHAVRGEGLGVADLLGRLSDQFSTLLRQELELAKAEARQEARTAARAGMQFGAAGLAGVLALVLVSLAAAWGLAEVLPVGIAFAIVGVVCAAVAGVLFGRAKKGADQLHPGLPETTASIRNDLDWARNAPKETP
ncbi:phage holin family protein [Salsipaludibacter albus]|uniref:phage holin family protein n=1 Tax=Salsipaludibacter albus TaxID=2849650 RepID=UPI001EE4A9D8|nr:phage holin family protein [Salsipaludibacter albus]MBY5161360.1 phage holin family protein [Salsipaludibacter albus]